MSIFDQDSAWASGTPGAPMMAPDQSLMQRFHSLNGELEMAVAQLGEKLTSYISSAPEPSMARPQAEASTEHEGALNRLEQTIESLRYVTRQIKV